jgi:hypothetical protein
MKTQLHLTGDAKTLDALDRGFLPPLGLCSLSQPPCRKPSVVKDNVIYVEVGYRTVEDTFLAGDQMAQVGAQIVEETSQGESNEGA